MLRFLENKKFTKLGETKERKVDIRIIAATNKDLKKETVEEAFRDDLYYRLAGFKIEIPPLRERTGDIPLLANFFMKRLNEKVQDIPKETMELLSSYPWQGNIRELKNIIERAVILAEGTSLTPDLLPEEFHQQQSSTFGISSNSSLSEVEQAHIKRVLDRVEGNKTKAADILGIGTSTLYRKIDEYDL